MATFTLDSSILSGGQFKTQAFDMSGEFREIQFEMSQSVSDQDAEVHFLEFHFEWAGVSMEDR